MFLTRVHLLKLSGGEEGRQHHACSRGARHGRGPVAWGGEHAMEGGRLLHVAGNREG
jgi:hypothetical protein